MNRPRALLILWLLSDLALFIASYALAYFLRVGFILSTDFPIDKFLFAVATTTPLWLMVLATTRTFALTRNQATKRNLAYIAYASLVGVALFTLIYYFQFTEFFSRKLLGYAFILSTGVIFAWHIVFQSIQRNLLRSNPPVFPTLIVGLTRESSALIKNLNKYKNPLIPVAILDGDGAHEKEIDGVPVLGKLNKLEEVIETKNITHLIQCSNLEQSFNLLSLCKNKGLHYIILPSVLGIIDRDERTESLEGMPVTVVNPKKNPLSWFLS